jgi:hypothetical protein
MSDDGYLQLTVNGSAGGQAFANVFYYGIDDGGPLNWTDALVAAALAEWGETVVGAWLLAMPDDYTLLNLEGRVVSERATVLSDNAVVLAVNEPGELVQAINGPFQTAIISFTTVRAEAYGYRSLKRSYIAFGPLGSTTMESTGALVLVALNYLGDVADLLATPLVVGLETLAPVRIARTVAPATPGVSLVTGASVAPFGSFRKSRKRRASGT